ncbi:MAG: MmcQ/YjbR family DNA-binding protein [Rhizobiales bacterium]|nr:MmcQ/YjbR family DNA-binding protein [Hyphomicrobiales bacterium]
MTFDDVRKMALAWPGVEDSRSYGTLSLKVKGKFLTRLREDGDSLVLKGVPFEEREMLMAAHPDVFYITDHYRDWPMVLVRLSKAPAPVVKALLLRSWRETAPKKLVAELDGRDEKLMALKRRSKSQQ